MIRVFLAESAILLGFHTIRMSLLILRHVVVTVLAFRTLQSNSCAHNFHLAFNIFTYVLLMVANHLILGIKKRPTSIRHDIVS